MMSIEKPINHQPIKAKNRIIEIDIIRGFALFGVLLVNVVFFSNITLYGLISGITVLSNPFNLSSSMDSALSIFIKLFWEGKFYTVFSFLFGLGFYMFIKRAEEKGFSAKVLFKRRLFALLIFGILHLVFVWYGDILHVYALGGFILLCLRNKSEKSLKRWIIILLIISTLLGILMTPSPIAVDTKYGEEDYYTYIEEVKNSFDIYENGSYLEILKFRVTNDIPYLLVYLLFIIPKTLAMFLIGVSFAKRDIFSDIEGNLHLVKKIWKITGVLGILSTSICISFGYVFLPSIVFSSILFGMFYELGTVFLSVFYITSLILLLRKEVAIRILSPLQWVGRMALTNYLTQCILCSFIFYGQGLGLVTNISLFEGVLFSIALFTLQIVFSSIWFKYFSFGPFEWIWRKYTYKTV